MDTIIQSLGFKAGETLENFIRQKINTLKYDKIIRANVILYKGPDSNPENNYCEIRLEIPGNDPFVKKHNLYFETAVSECIDVLNEQLSRNKAKNNGMRQDPISILEETFSKDENEADNEIATDLEDS